MEVELLLMCPNIWKPVEELTLQTILTFSGLKLRLRRRLGTVYRLPTDLEFFIHFESILSRACSEKNKICLLIGDLQLQHTLARNSKHTILLDAIAAEYQLQQLISSPTRVTENSRIIIGLIFTSERPNEPPSSVTRCSLSDHHIVSCHINTKHSQPPQHFALSKCLNKCDLDALNKDMMNTHGKLMKYSIILMTSLAKCSWPTCSQLRKDFESVPNSYHGSCND